MDDETLFTISGCGRVISFWDSIVVYLINLVLNSVMAERNCLVVLDSWLDKFYLVLQVSLFAFVRVVLCLRFFSILGYRPEFVTRYGLLSPRLVSVLGLYRCFQSDSLLYLVFSLYSYWPIVFHPSIDIMPCAFRLAYIRLKFDWKAEEMEGKRAVSLLAYDHPSSSPAGLVCSFYLPLRICNNSSVSWFVSA